MSEVASNNCRPHYRIKLYTIDCHASTNGMLLKFGELVHSYEYSQNFKKVWRSDW